MQKEIPMRRFGKPAEIADLIFYKEEKEKQSEDVFRNTLSCISFSDAAKKSNLHFLMAERGGFEPPRACTLRAFQARALGHYAISPAISNHENPTTNETFKKKRTIHQKSRQRALKR